MKKEKLLTIHLYTFGILKISIIPVLTCIYGDIMLWLPRNIPTEMMMNAIYISMGILMIITARNPRDHKTFIDFLILSSISHALVMLIYTENIFHIGDVIIMGAMGIIPLIIYPWSLKNFLS